jgi:hypothetical protein
VKRRKIFSKLKRNNKIYKKHQTEQEFIRYIGPTNMDLEMYKIRYI